MGVYFEIARFVANHDSEYSAKIAKIWMAQYEGAEEIQEIFDKHINKHIFSRAQLLTKSMIKSETSELLKNEF